MKKAKIALISLFIALGVITALPAVSYAADPAKDIRSGVSAIGGGQTKSFESNLQTIVNILLYVLGAIAVVMIVIGGIRYTTSNGEASQIKSAKDTILYSVIGLIVAIMAYAIVNFVVGAF